MKCLKISHRVILSLLFALFALPFLFSSGRAYASSASFSYSNADNNYPTTFYEYTPSNVGFDFSYVKIEAHTSENALYRATNCWAVSNGSVGVDGGIIYFDYLSTSYAFTHNYFMLKNKCGSDTLTLTFYDYDPGITTPCPECPEVPEETEVLLDIKRSILFIPAMLFVIYLFYILYSFYIGGSR